MYKYQQIKGLHILIYHFSGHFCTLTVLGMSVPKFQKTHPNTSRKNMAHIAKTLSQQNQALIQI